MGRPVSWYGTKKGKEEINRMNLEYMKAVNKSEGFDVSGLPLPSRYCGVRGLVETICAKEGCAPLPFLYAKMGLHRYNLLHGKNLQLSSVKKYNESTGSAASIYYITLEAKDPSIDDSLLTFQTKVHEQDYGELDLSCSIARPLGETKRSEIGAIKSSSDHKPLLKPFYLVDDVPEWPPENPFEDSKRCRVLKESELQEENNEWIRLYLELAVATTNRHTLKNHDLSNLKILKVAIDTSTQDLEEPIDPKFAAIVYIRYKDSCEPRVGNDVDRIAIVRRFFNQRGGSFSLVGQNLSSDIVIPNKGVDWIKKKDISMDSRALERKAFLDSFKPAKSDEDDQSHDDLEDVYV